MTPMPDSEPLVLERTFDATVTRVWTALTHLDAIRQWFFQLPAFESRVGFEFGFTVECEGQKYVHQCLVTEVVPESRLAYTWQYEGIKGESTITYVLFAEGDKTRLRFTHAGLETFPKEPEFSREKFLEGWNWLVNDSLKAHLEGPIPTP